MGTPAPDSDPIEKFDFIGHEKAAVADYLQVVNFYADLAEAAKRIAEEALKKRHIKIHAIEARAKDPASFGKKAATPSDDDPLKPKYPNPLVDIKDQAAIRIITFFPRTVVDIDQVINKEFRIVEQCRRVIAAAVGGVLIIFPKHKVTGLRVRHQGERQR